MVALTTIGSFATPAYNATVALRVLRFLLTGLAGIFGLNGVMIGLILISHHMLSLRSFDVPCLSPIAPADWEGRKDAWVRMPIWWLPKRPRMLHPRNPDRLGRETMDDFLSHPARRSIRYIHAN